MLAWPRVQQSLYNDGAGALLCCSQAVLEQLWRQAAGSNSSSSSALQAALLQCLATTACLAHVCSSQQHSQASSTPTLSASQQAFSSAVHQALQEQPPGRSQQPLVTAVLLAPLTLLHHAAAQEGAGAASSAASDLLQQLTSLAAAGAAEVQHAAACSFTSTIHVLCASSAWRRLEAVQACMQRATTPTPGKAQQAPSSQAAPPPSTDPPSTPCGPVREPSSSIWYSLQRLQGASDDTQDEQGCPAAAAGLPAASVLQPLCEKLLFSSTVQPAAQLAALPGLARYLSAAPAEALQDSQALLQQLLGLLQHQHDAVRSSLLQHVDCFIRPAVLEQLFGPGQGQQHGLQRLLKALEDAAGSAADKIKVCSRGRGGRLLLHSLRWLHLVLC
jgi:hypothetical protein